ncbi:MAG TPA: peptidoglycan editing factor PgeF [Rhodanobacteraceae bacterium]
MSEDCSQPACGRLRLHNDLQRAFTASLIHPEWPAPSGVLAVTTTRVDPAPSQRSAYGFNIGTRCGDDPTQVARNREFLRDALALPSEPAWLRQVHGIAVARFSPLPRAGEDGTRATQTGEGSDTLSPQDPAADAAVTRKCGVACAASSQASLPPLAGEGARRADEGDGATEPEADAAVTRASGVVLAIQTADCLPVLFCTRDGSAIAAAHAGWRGLAAGVLEATLVALDAPREHVMAWLGPAIGRTSYEVGAEVRAAFLAHDPAAQAAFTATRPGHWYCDLYALARQRLHAAGVTQVFGGTFDTLTDARLHSYRRDGALSGRMVSLIWMAR